MKVAIYGMRHGHIASIAKHVKVNKELELVAAAEPEPNACRTIIKAAEVEITHRSLDELLSDVEFDILAVGDVYARRGEVIIKALEAGKHILADKPLCTRLDELERIEKTVRSSGRACIQHLSLRYQGTWQAAHRALQEGRIGTLRTVTVTGRHPLDYKTGRPAWYFKKGLHGGTLNDLGVHGLDGLEWLTGIPLAEVVAARAWNQEFPEVPFFQNAAQAMLRMANGAGVLLDASYTTPRGVKDRWTLHFHGTKGHMLLTTAQTLELQREGEKAIELPSFTAPRSGVVDDLVCEVSRPDAGRVLTTEDSLRAARLALLTQQAADEQRTHVALT